MAPELLKGLTGNYITVFIDDREDLQNSIVDVKIEALLTYSEKEKLSVALKGNRI